MLLGYKWGNLLRVASSLLYFFGQMAIYPAVRSMIGPVFYAIFFAAERTNPIQSRVITAFAMRTRTVDDAAGYRQC